MRDALPALLLVQGAFACISTAPRTFSVPNAQFAQPVALPGTGFQSAGPAVAVPRPVVGAAPNEAVLTPVGASESRQTSVLQYLLGDRIQLSTFTADYYNAQGGGPVTSGAALTCRLDGTPCCWANVPANEDQLDWQIATGKPTAATFENAPAPNGSYLIAYARGAAPSDEAQFSSCSIACASSPITVRAKHWQTENVLLQVCQRESFPQSASFNPLLNCQEFPLQQGLGTTEVQLPKGSFIDIVFVASNFVGETGDMAILDDIEISYDNKGEECQQAEQAQASVDQEQQEESEQPAANSIEQQSAEELSQGAHRLTLETNAKPEQATLEGSQLKAHLDSLKQARHFTSPEAAKKAAKGVFSREGLPVEPAASGPLGTTFIGEHGEAEHGFAHVATQGSATETGAEEDFSEEQPQSFARALGKTTFKEAPISEPSGRLAKTSKEEKGAKGEKGEPEPLNPAEPPCQATSCTFENGNTCHYQDAHQTQSIRGLTTKFQVVTGQFMNKITGIKSGVAGEYYAATFLFPREMAGLETATEPFTREHRIRFHYYESTHGVQLKGCCGTIDDCPFLSDKFVSVGDRVWKSGSLICPRGTEKVIFVCENTRTNQGACAIDDIEMVDERGKAEDAMPLC